MEIKYQSAIDIFFLDIYEEWIIVDAKTID